MQPADAAAFTDMLDAVCSALSRGNYKASAANTAIYFRALRRYPLEVVRAAFDAHVSDPTRGRFVPVPADLIAQIDAMQSDDGRLGGEEAWALALRSQDENVTVVWTVEVAEAFKSARSVLAGGDEVGARMAFKEAYARIVRVARAEQVPVQWQASLGYDPQQRDQALAEAIAAGLLPAPGAQLTGFSGEPLQLPAPRATGLLLLEGGQLAGDDQHQPVPAPPEAREALRALREQLAVREPSTSVADAEREDWQQRKDEAMRRAGWMSPGELYGMLDAVRQGARP